MRPNLYQSSWGSFIVGLLVLGTNTSLWRTSGKKIHDLVTFFLLHFCKNFFRGLHLIAAGHHRSVFPHVHSLLKSYSIYRCAHLEILMQFCAILVQFCFIFVYVENVQ